MPLLELAILHPKEHNDLKKELLVHGLEYNMSHKE